MHYKINVSHNGMHFFATADHSITDPSHLAVVFNEFQKRFPKNEGFELNAWYYQDEGASVNVNSFIKEYQPSIRRMETDIQSSLDSWIRIQKYQNSTAGRMENDIQ
jgi:uncharacterized protein (DUF2345 family)